ncbi:MAG: maleate cis-trans isomerase family protein [Marivita sp.]|uniref:maleate cis-trans isomerase family protein n=1 Tax=Marivita sp. TaxID=2003365 RepID=UPI003EF2EC80
MALPYTFETDRPTQIGLITLQSDETIERDFRTLLPVDVECLVSRVPSGTTVSLDSLRAMENSLTDAAKLLPRGAQIAAVGYGCTSASAAIGAARVAELIRAGVSTPHVSDPLTALIAACKAGGITRIGLVSPYVASVSDRLIQGLEVSDVSVVSFGSFDEPQEDRVVRISRQSVRDAAIHVGQGGPCDAVFLSCTNLRALEIVSEVEVVLNIPVLTSNQVLAWHLGRLAGFSGTSTPSGRLFAFD